MPGIASRSLAFRLLLASALMLPLILGISAWMLDLAFERALLAAEKERLNTQIYLLLAAAELQGGHLQLPAQLTEPRFSQLDSGLYARVLDSQHREIWRSASAGLATAFNDSSAALSPGRAVFERSGSFFRFDYDVAWEDDAGLSSEYRFSVLHSQRQFSHELTSWRKRLWWWSFILAISLVLAQWLILRWGLKPLRALSVALRNVEQGSAGEVQGQYPAEIAAVTDNLNRVLKTERTQRERYRNTLADLAHSLKTPLAVLRGALGDGGSAPPSALVEQQVSRMDQIVRHQLQRAVVDVERRPGEAVDALQVCRRLCEALQKVYVARAVHCQIRGESARFYGGEADLMEALGNVLDNAFKYTGSQVEVTVADGNDGLAISVEDNGDGVPDSMRSQILQRGARADSAQPGHGIGLAITADIVSSYRGSLSVTRSALGGACFRIVFPHN